MTTRETPRRSRRGGRTPAQATGGPQSIPGQPFGQRQALDEIQAGAPFPSEGNQPGTDLVPRTSGGGGVAAPPSDQIPPALRRVLESGGLSRATERPREALTEGARPVSVLPAEPSMLIRAMFSLTRDPALLRLLRG